MKRARAIALFVPLSLLGLATGCSVLVDPLDRFSFDLEDAGSVMDAGHDAALLVDAGPLDAGRDAFIPLEDGGTCTEPLVACGDGCVNTDEDADHCGACEHGCPEGWSCREGACEDRAVQVAAGGATTCAVTESGALYCWGANGDGQVGVASAEASFDSPQRVALPLVSQVGVGVRHVCAVGGAGEVHCWGANFAGQLGLGHEEDRDAPQEVSVRATASAVSVGLAQSCARLTDGTVQCWGLGSTFGADGNVVVPMDLPGSDLEAVETGISGTCTRTMGSHWSCTIGALESLAATAISIGVAVIFRHSGELHCWEPEPGRCMIDDEGPELGPIAVTPPPVQRIQAGNAPAFGGFFSFFYAIDADERLWHWGVRPERLAEEMFGDPDREPRLVSGVANVQDVAAGFHHACALAEGGRVWCWGGNAAGQLGLEEATTRVGPVRLPFFPVRE